MENDFRKTDRLILDKIDEVKADQTRLNTVIFQKLDKFHDEYYIHRELCYKEIAKAINNSQKEIAKDISDIQTDVNKVKDRRWMFTTALIAFTIIVEGITNAWSYVVSIAKAVVR